MQEERKKLGRKFKSDTVKSRVDGIKLEQYFDKSFNISEGESKSVSSRT